MRPTLTANLIFALLLTADTMRTAFAGQKSLALGAGLPRCMAVVLAGVNAGIVATPLSITNSILAPIFLAYGCASAAALCIAIPGIAEVALVTAVLRGLAVLRSR